MGALLRHYFQYYYKDEILAELQARPTTCSQDIRASIISGYAKLLCIDNVVFTVYIYNEISNIHLEVSE